MKKYALIGAAGFIAPKHMRAILLTGGDLVCILDPSDSVGVIDNYFPKAKYFREFERFDREIYKLQSTKDKIDYLVICSPNYLHEAHARYGLRMGMDIICEKPMTINIDNVSSLRQAEVDTGQKINNILQLRYLPEIIELRGMVQRGELKPQYISLDYMTMRGPWLDFSWKGDVEKSGGLIMNIGIHLFDMLFWVFGKAGIVAPQYTLSEDGRSFTASIFHESGFTSGIKLSINMEDIPAGEGSSYRRLKIGSHEVKLSGEKFKDLHTHSYEEILSGRGWGIGEASYAVEFISRLRWL